MPGEAYLVLEDGQIFVGEAFGALEDTVGEVVFTTAMTGYLETLTDPSYCGQIVVQAFPLIGNYGVIPADFESGIPRLSGYIVSEWCSVPSNFRSEGNVSAFLQAQGIPGLCGIDTRALVKRIRRKGTVNGALVHDKNNIETAIKKAAGYQLVNPVAQVSGQTKPDTGRAGPLVVLWDFGAKNGIVQRLRSLGCRVTAIPHSTTAEEIAAMEPDGILLSNGPGDPAENESAIHQIGLVTRMGIPLFGICLGHQLLALSQGARTEKLLFGHRGANQPVMDTVTGRVEITSQNHGYAVIADSLSQGAIQRYVNANDGTCEGIDYKDFPGFSVQFHPEGCGGPLDTEHLFDRFIDMMKRHGKGVGVCH